MSNSVPDRVTNTRQIRVADDLGEMLSWIVDLEGGRVADFLDPVLRPWVEWHYRRVADRVEAIKAARAETETIFAPDLGESGA